MTARPRRGRLAMLVGALALGASVGVVAAAPGVEIVTIEADPIVITGPQGTFGTTTVGISATPGMTPTSLTEVHVVGTDAAYFTFPNLTCQDGQNCVFAPLALRYVLTVGCTPDASAHSATLVIRGTGDATDTDSATLTCTPAAGPMLTASPATVTIAPSPAVGETSAGQALTLTNVGTGTLTVELAANDFASEWLFTPACTHAVPCQLIGMGATQVVTVQLRPDTHGAHDTTLAILTNEATNPNHSVQLVGAGHGAFVVVDEPSPTTFSFGTIPRAQVGRQLVRLRDTGNDPTVVTITTPGAPFAADAPSVALLAAGTAMFEATCTSATPFDGAGDYLLASSAYNSPTTIHATCKVVDTPITIAPLRFEFGELRLGAPAVELPFTIGNPTTGDIAIAELAIAHKPGVLELDVPATTTTLHGGDTLAGVVRLHSTTDGVIADDVTLDFTADGVALRLPITGRVVTPHARIDPIALDLGTACVGSPAIGTIRIVNDGTATLIASAPTVDQAFVTRLGDTTYPATLHTDSELAVELQPAASIPGSIHGVLTWPVDASATPFSVPVDLDYIEAGAAVSPQRYDFGAIAVDGSSDRRVVTLENCNGEPLTITIAGIVTTAGDADAWDVQPRTEQRVLGAHETMKLMVRFAPKHRGAHVAQISLIAGDRPAAVDLRGEALGPLPSTSFYACACNAPGVPVGGVPIACAIVLVLRRRQSPRTA